MSKANAFTFDNSDFRSPTTPAPPMQSETDMKTLGRKRVFNAAKIELDRIISRPQVRQHFDEDELQELADSLKSKGQQQPIRVWWDQDAEGEGRYVILMGERRYRAAKLAGFNDIECLVHEEPLSDAEITELQLIENIIRADLNAVEEAKAFKKIMADREAAGLPCTAKDIAKEIGISDTKVQRSVRLLTLPEDILADVADGTIPPSVIRQMWRLKTEDERRKLVADYKSGSSFGEISESVKLKKTGKGNAGPRTKKSFTVDGIKIEVTAKRRVTQMEIAAAMKEWVKQIQSDGRSKAA
ncbi:ParB/RepB/Spo0J family partition protein [Crateriforma conspicua]|uniref:Chromosome-partitioning protein Spo0J n=1 Tax=Crateriforma conspicua TaxID=2527996 RepID=A0A5C6FDW2_9PLAN|nr:ParB/RepB/Spo0J family partition protein [Crateriforma conspicua]TWU59633.1 Chromosome-partitioning protein Spo0J [Crateriforma conspicua]